MSLRTSNGNTTSVQHQLARSGDVSYRDRRSRWGSTKVRDHLYTSIYSLATVSHRLPLPLRLSVVRYFTSRNVKHLTFSSDDHLGQALMCGRGFIGDHTICSISMVFLGRKKLGIVVLVRGCTRTV